MPDSISDRTAVHYRLRPKARTDQVRVEPAVRRIQSRMRKYKKPGESVVDQFLADRRALWGEE